MDLQTLLSKKVAPSSSKAEPMQSIPTEQRSCIFYKLMVESVIQAQELAIPKKFVRRFGEKLSDNVTLVDSNSDVWLVGLRKADQRLWFRYGWQKFVEDHYVHVGCFMIFKYEGSSKFSVYIYDLAAAEMKLSAKTCGSSVGSICEKQLQVPSIEYPRTRGIFQNVDLFPSKPAPGCPKGIVLSECAGPKISSTVTDSLPIDRPTPKVRNHSVKLTQDIGDRVCAADLMQTLDDADLHSSDQANTKCRKRVISELVYGNSDDQFKKQKVPVEVPNEASSVNWTRRYRAVTDEEKRRAALAAKTFKSNLPFCRVTMRPSYVYSSSLLYLPTSFCQKHLKEIRGNIKLQDSDGRQWPARCTGTGSNAWITKGWRQFVAANKLDEGDVCVFELVQERILY